MRSFLKALLILLAVRGVPAPEGKTRSKDVQSYLNQFIQPDTIIPDLSNSQSWNRYSYVGNNPILFADPSGHIRTDENGSSRRGCSDPKYCLNGRPKPVVPKPRPVDPSDGGRGDERTVDDVLKVLDNLAWDYIPSAIGLHGNLTWSGGAGAEVNLTPIELLLIANWRSGEISLMLSMEGSGMFTLPDLFGLSLNGGVTEVYGASTNSELEGWAHFGGYSLSAGEVLNIGVSRNYGTAKKNVWGTENYIDPISSREVKYRQSAVFAALSAPVVASPVDGSLFGGVSCTKELINSPLPYWPLR